MITWRTDLFDKRFLAKSVDDEMTVPISRGRGDTDVRKFVTGGGE